MVLRFVAFFTILIGFFMALLDSTVVNITLPRMIEYFHTDMSTISWVVNGYNIAFAVFLITASRLADQFGRKRLFVLGLAGFTLTSFLAGRSSNEDLLVFFRVLQGLSGAMIVPVSMPLILELFPKERSGAIVGVWGAVAGVAAASGPALGGIIGEYFQWQWIFYINVPIGIAAIVLTLIMVRESYDTTASKSIDWGGMLTLSAGSFALTLALVQANDKGWTSAYILSLFAIAAAGIASFAFLEARIREPMLPRGLLRQPQFAAANITLFFLGIALMCGVFFLAFFLTRVMEMTQLRAGLMITALPLAAMVFSAISGPLSDRTGSRWFGIAGLVVAIVGTYLCGALTPASSNREVLALLVVCGAGMGLALPPVVGASIKAVPPDKIGIASGVGNMSRTMGAVLGVALLVMMLTHFADRSVEHAKADAVRMVSADEKIQQQFRDAAIAQIREVRFSKTSEFPTQERILGKFAERQQAVLDTLPPMKKAIMRAVFKTQTERITVLYPQLKKIFVDGIAKAFTTTFHLAAFVLLLGLIPAWFCDPVRKKEVRGQKSEVSP